MSLRFLTFEIKITGPATGIFIHCYSYVTVIRFGVGRGRRRGRARGRGWRLLFLCCCFRCCNSQKSQFTVCRSINCLKIDCRRKNNVLNEIKSRQLNSTSYPKSRVLRIHSKFGHQACWIDWPTKYIEYNRKWGFRSRYPVFKAVKNGGQFSSKVVFWHTTMGEIFLFKSRSTIYTSHLDFKLK